MTQPSTNLFLYIFRGGADTKKMAEMSPEEMQKSMDAWFGWINDLRSKGHFQGGEPLFEEGKVLRGKNGQSVTDGPFAEGKEVVGGYMVIKSGDLGEAVELSKRCPVLTNDGSVEVRPIHKIVDV